MITIGSVESWGTGGPDYFAPPDYIPGHPYFSEGVLTAGQPVELDIRSYLGFNAHTGTVVNKGPGNLYVQISSDGTNYSDVITIEEFRAISLNREDVYKIKLDTDTDGCSYMVVAH